MSPNDTNAADLSDALSEQTNAAGADTDTVAETAGPIGETKEDKFRRLAKLRVTNVLKGVRILGGLSNTATYSYTPEQVEKIFSSIQAQLDKARGLFSPVKKVKDETDFEL